MVLIVSLGAAPWKLLCVHCVTHDIWRLLFLLRSCHLPFNTISSRLHVIGSYAALNACCPLHYSGSHPPWWVG